MRSALIALGSHREAGPKPAPVLEHIVDAPDGKESVDDEQPLVHDAVIRADLSAGVFLDCAVLWVGLRSAFAHDRAASLLPGSASPGRSVGGLPEERGASFASSSARSEEHTSELPSLCVISYAVFCLEKKKLNKRLSPKFTSQNAFKEEWFKCSS